MTLMEYIQGLTTFSFEDSILQRVLFDRGVVGDEDAGCVCKRTRELIYADLLFAIYTGPKNVPSYTHQHGQFSETIGAQNYGDMSGLWNVMRSIYRRYNDPKLEEAEGSSLEWME